MGIGIPSGLLLAYLINFDVDSNVENNNFIWRFNFGISLVICVLRILMLLFKYTNDTPDYHLIIEKNESNSMKSLSSIYKIEYIN